MADKHPPEDFSRQLARTAYTVCSVAAEANTNVATDAMAETVNADEASPSTGISPHRPAAAPSNRGKKFPVEILTSSEIGALIAQCSSRAPTGIRNRALIACLYRGGLRISEALALKPKDVDHRAGTVTVLHGKGDRRRVVGMDPAAFSLLQRWIDKRTELGIPARSFVFCTLRGQAIRDNYVRTLLPRLAAKAGVEKRVHPHGLRHTHAAELAAEGVPVTVIQQQLGHGTLSMTERYLRHIAPQERIKAMQARQWTGGR